MMRQYLKLTKQEWQIYKQRNIEYYVKNKLYGVHCLKLAMGRSENVNTSPFINSFQNILKKLVKFLSNVIPITKYRKSFRDFLLDILNSSLIRERLKAQFAFKLFDKIYIPQVEFAITTKCNLKCKNCRNYIPYLPDNKQKTMDFQHFKNYLDNLTANVSKLNSLLLLGGEPLLNKELPQMLEYSLMHKKIENIYITTNGTIKFSEELKSVFDKHKYSKKLWIWVSNYTANPKLAQRLKTLEIVDYLKTNGINYIFINENVWHESLPPTYQETKRTDEENSQYFLDCNTPCVSVYGNELSVCPRASHFALNGTIKQGGGERLLLDGKISKENLIAFYTYTNFRACRYCDIKNEGKPCIPAIQIDEKVSKG